MSSTTNKVLYSVHLGRHVQGHAKGPVRAIENTQGVTGHWFEGIPLNPDWAAVRECLPHYYRKAFDRQSLRWFPDHFDQPATVNLYGSRGNWLNTVYLQPYQRGIK